MLLFTDHEHGMPSKTAVFDFSQRKGAYMLPYEFRAKGNDEHQAQESIAEQSSVDIEHQSNEARDPEKKEDEALENYLEAGQDIVQAMQPSCFPNVFNEVYPTNNLLVFRLGRNYIVDASISKIFIRNFGRPIVKGNLFASDKTNTEIIGQHIVSFRETDSNKLLQLKLSPLFRLNSISTWVALLISYLAYIWSQVRHLCSNYFGFRNIMPRFKILEKADASIMAYLKASDKKYRSQNTTE